MKTGWILTIWILFLGTLFLGFFVAVPAYFHFCSDFSTAAYFSFIQPYLTFILASSGLLLGLFYYFDARQRRLDQKTSDDKRANAQTIHSILCDYEAIAMELLLKIPADNKELALMRMRLNAKSDDLSVFVESAANILSLSDSEISTLLRPYASLDKDENASIDAYTDYFSADLQSLISQVSAEFRKAKELILRKFVNG